MQVEICFLFGRACNWVSALFLMNYIKYMNSTSLFILVMLILLLSSGSKITQLYLKL